ncbi:MAG TPA: carboxypeptidase-like regulatory domain-containing protein, partial [Acidimicrobiales bacterium]|nr:carboxypeptidase-like regulatory domain-containing protein [Acidimicrobiales bacterium]
MRVEVLTPSLAVKPGTSCDVELEVFNTSEVIDSIRAGVEGFDSEQSPPQLALFPETGDRVTLSFKIPQTLHAGSHTLDIGIQSVFHDEESQRATIDIDVAPVVSAAMRLTPSEITGRKKATTVVEVTNKGNTDLDLTLTGGDVERVLRWQFEPLFLHLAPGETASSTATMVGRRPFFGGAVQRTTHVRAWGSGAELTEIGIFRQKPYIPKGVLTFLLLGGIVALWAAVFVAGANLVLAKDDLTKTAAETFLGEDAASFDGTTVAGSLSGTVNATTNGLPIERITVEAFRVDGDGNLDPAGSAASDDKGVWELATVQAGTYVLRLSAPGYEDTWYPGVASPEQAERIRVRPTVTTADLVAEIDGVPGSITGAIIAGEQAEILAKIVVRRVLPNAPAEVVATIDTLPDGTFSIPDLPTPSTYELGVLLAGFDQQAMTVALAGGQNAVTNTLNMAAAPGTMSGTVIGPDGLLGGVEITLTGGGQSLAATTPTSGAVGSWTFADLPTPGTYLLTFALDGFGTQTVALDLRAGQALQDVVVELLEGTGTVAGRVVDGDGNGIGGVVVTVTGAAEPLSTTTLTTGDVGAYVLTGLATPGRYTLTFTLEGFAGQTLGVELINGGSASDVDAMLTRSTASIVGTISGDDSALAGAIITLTDGTTVRETASADQPSGGFRFDGIPPGRYTMTVVADGFVTRTVL